MDVDPNIGVKDLKFGAGILFAIAVLAIILAIVS
jgi:hypothetical protein